MTNIKRQLPRGVIALGLVSLFMDTSSELIHSLLPAYMVSTLGLTVLTVGLIEGIAESTAAITKIFAGVISDWIGRRKPLVLLGYGIAALTKPLFPLANGAPMVLTARFLDRIGKGIRGAPRDALIADLTAESIRGAAYGLRQSMDTVGAFVAPPEMADHSVQYFKQPLS
jgi:MFS family permease